MFIKNIYVAYYFMFKFNFKSYIYRFCMLRGRLQLNNRWKFIMWNLLNQWLLILLRSRMNNWITYARTQVIANNYYSYINSTVLTCVCISVTFLNAQKIQRRFNDFTPETDERLNKRTQIIQLNNVKFKNCIRFFTKINDSP